MVFENLLAPLLERFLGQYIVDLPREQLRVGVWSGVVRLENVRLKPAAFDHLKLPFAVREGTIGLVELKLALKTVLLSARQHPFVITLDAISVTASPRTEDEWAAEPAARRALALKRAALAAAALRCNKPPRSASAVVIRMLPARCVLAFAGFLDASSRRSSATPCCVGVDCCVIVRWK